MSEALNMDMEALLESMYCAKPELRPKEKISIAFSTNENYVPLLLVAIESLVAHSDKEKEYEIIVLHTSLSTEMIEILEGATTIENVEVRCRNVTTEVEREKKKLEQTVKLHYSVEMFYRLLLPELLPSHKKIVYLDCDLVLCADVAELFATDVSGVLMAAVKEPLLPQYLQGARKRLELDNEQYFNSGVLVMNLESMREKNVAEKCFGLIKKFHPEILYFPDQDVLNIVCKGQVCFLDQTWNIMWGKLADEEHGEVSRKSIGYQRENIKIIHYASQTKPHTVFLMLMAGEFFVHSNKTRFKGKSVTDYYCNRYLGGLLVNDDNKERQKE